MKCPPDISALDKMYGGRFILGWNGPPPYPRNFHAQKKNFSARYVSMLFANENAPTINTSETLSYIRDRLDHTILLQLQPTKFVGYDKEVKKKEEGGQPISLTDYYGCCIGDALLGEVRYSSSGLRCEISGCTGVCLVLVTIVTFLMKRGNREKTKMRLEIV